MTQEQEQALRCLAAGAVTTFEERNGEYFEWEGGEYRFQPAEFRRVAREVVWQTLECAVEELEK